MTVRKLFLDRPIESLAMSIHFRRPGVGVVMNQVKTAQLSVEMLLEFAPVIGEHEGDGIRKYLSAELKEFFCRKRSVGSSRPGKTKTCVNVLKRNEITAHSVNENFYGVQGNEMSWVLGLEMLRFSKDFLSISFLHSPRACNAKGYGAEPAHVVYEPSYGNGLWTRELLSLTEFLKERINFLFSEVGMLFPQSAYFGDDSLIPPPFSLHPGTCRASVQTLELASALFELLFPEKEGASLYSVDLFRLLGTAFFPVGKDGGSLFCFFGNHIPEAYHAFPARNKASGILEFIEDFHRSWGEAFSRTSAIC